MHDPACLRTKIVSSWSTNSDEDQEELNIPTNASCVEKKITIFFWKLFFGNTLVDRTKGTAYMKVPKTIPILEELIIRIGQTKSG